MLSGWMNDIIMTKWWTKYQGLIQMVNTTRYNPLLFIQYIGSSNQILMKLIQELEGFRKLCDKGGRK